VARRGTDSHKRQCAMKEYRVYCDTNTLRHNIEKDPKEKKAFDSLLNYESQGRIVMIGSKGILRETEKTPDDQQKKGLRQDYDQLKAVANDEKILGHQSQPDPYRGHSAQPFVSDVQDETIFSKLLGFGVGRSDAQLLTQAICNDCHVFLTRDKKSIIRPHRHKIEACFPIRVMTPLELVRLLRPCDDFA